MTQPVDHWCARCGARANYVFQPSRKAVPVWTCSAHKDEPGARLALEPLPRVAAPLPKPGQGKLL